MFCEADVPASTTPRLCDLDHPIWLPPPHQRTKPEKENAVEHGPVWRKVDLCATCEPSRVYDSDSPASLEHREPASEDRRSSQLDASLEQLDVEIGPPPTWFRCSRKDLSLVLDNVVAADNLVAVEAVASVVEIELRRLAP